MTQLQAPDQPTTGRHLSDLDEEERYRSFDDRQLAMPAVWESMQRGFADESVVVVPSISIERTTAGSGTVMQALEERALFLLLLLRQPQLRMIYVTSQPVSRRSSCTTLACSRKFLMPAPGSPWSLSVMHHRSRLARNCLRGRDFCAKSDL
jgi:hypothetical protein